MITLRKKILTDRGDHCTTESLLDYPSFGKYCKLIVIHLSKKHKLDTDPKAKH